MAKKIEEMEYALDQFSQEHTAFRSVFFEISRLLNSIIESKNSALSQGGPCAFHSATIKDDRDRDAFTLEFLSRSYEFRFISKIKTLSGGYVVVGGIKVIMKFAHDPEDDIGVEVANFDFNSLGHVSRLNSLSRQLTDKAHLEAFMVEFLFNDLVADVRAAAAKADPETTAGI